MHIFISLNSLSNFLDTLAESIKIQAFDLNNTSPENVEERYRDNLTTIEQLIPKASRSAHRYNAELATFITLVNRKGYGFSHNNELYSDLVRALEEIDRLNFTARYEKIEKQALELRVKDLQCGILITKKKQSDPSPTKGIDEEIDMLVNRATAWQQMMSEIDQAAEVKDVAFESMDAATDTVKKKAIQIKRLRIMVQTLRQNIIYGYNLARKEPVRVKLQRAQAKIQEQNAEIKELKKENQRLQGNQGSDANGGESVIGAGYVLKISRGRNRGRKLAILLKAKRDGGGA